MGIFWHANPIKYSINFINKKNNKTAEQLWERDKIKNDTAVKNGFDVMTVWEYDFKRNKEEVIKKCLAFLQK
jgi:G:T-mismatch repair DNA endonuclease (very short patch repair protein)